MTVFVLITITMSAVLGLCFVLGLVLEIQRQERRFDGISAVVDQGDLSTPPPS